MAKYGIGFDPGYRNLGIGILNFQTDIGELWLVDLHAWDGVVHNVTPVDYGVIIYDLIRILSYFLKDTFIVGIENQPSIGTRNVLRIQTHLESTIRGLYPDIKIALTSPLSVRKFWDTSGGTYAERKLKSLNSDMLNSVDNIRVQQAFTKVNLECGRSTVKVDAIEAMQICVYMKHNLHKLKCPTVFKEPRAFSTKWLGDLDIKKSHKEVSVATKKDEKKKKFAKPKEESENNEQPKKLVKSRRINIKRDKTEPSTGTKKLRRVDGTVKKGNSDKDD